MRVLWEASALLPPRTGVGRYAFELLRALLAREDAPQVQGVWRSLRREMPPSDLAALVDFHAFTGRWPPGPWLMRQWGRGRGPLIEQLAGPAELVHGVAAVLPRSECPARLLTIHDLFFLKQRTHDALGGGLLRRHLPRFAPEATRVIVPSQAVAEDCVQLLGLDRERIDVIHHGGAEFFAREPTAEQWQQFDRAWEGLPSVGAGLAERHWLAFGNLHPRKNLPLLIEAQRRLGDSALPLHVTVIDDPVRFMRRFARLRGRPPKGNEGFKTILGVRVSDAQMRCSYRRASALVMPSLDEGFGLPVLEAMASGCPVICSDIPVFREITGGHARFFDPHDPDSLAAALEAAQRDPEGERHRAQAAWEHAQPFTWARCAEKTFAVYRRAIAEAQSR